ncbi:MAG: hypothetical protein ABDH28_05500 [Brevinematia bacterium]
MLQEKEWKLKFNLLLLEILNIKVIPLILAVSITLGCETPNHHSENLEETNLIATKSKIVEEIEKFKDVKFGLGEKFLIEGIDYLSTMNYNRAIYSLSKSIFYNPIPSETKYLLAKAYFNSGKIKNAIDLLEEIKDSELSTFVLPKLSSIYSRLSLSFNYKLPLSYFSLTNIYGILSNRKVFSLPSSIRFFPEKGIAINSFSDGKFLTFDNQFSLSHYTLGKKIVDIAYDDDKKVFWLLGFSELYEYSEGWFNLNVLNINTKKIFKFSGTNFRKISILDEWLYILDTLSKKILVISKEDGRVLFSFPEASLHNPKDLEVYSGKIFVSDSNEIKVFSKYGEHLYSLTFRDMINGFCTFGDSFVVASDNGIFLLSREGNTSSIVEGHKFDDVAIGYENKIYALSTEENRIEVLGNEYLHTYNLDVDIKGVFSQHFPMIGVLVGVRNIQQDFIDNLRSYNFEVLESGASIVMPECEQTYSFLKRKSLYIVIEKSKEVFENIDIITSFLRELLEQLRPSDHINLSIVDENFVTFGKTNVSVLTPLEFIEKKFTAPSERYKILDGISTAVTELLYSVRRNAVLVISSGNLESDSSLTDIYTLLDYAYNNFIPIYVISLSTNNELKTLALSTGGKYYDKSVLLSPTIFLRDYEKVRVFRYLVVFKSLHETLYPDGKLVDLEVRVRYGNLFGKDRTKYVFPKVKKASEGGGAPAGGH